MLAARGLETAVDECSSVIGLDDELGLCVLFDLSNGHFDFHFRDRLKLVTSLNVRLSLLIDLHFPLGQAERDLIASQQRGLVSEAAGLAFLNQLAGQFPGNDIHRADLNGLFNVRFSHRFVMTDQRNDRVDLKYL